MSSLTVAIVSSCLLLIGALVGHFSTRATSGGQQAVEFNASLLERLNVLEAKVCRLETDLSTERTNLARAIAYIERLLGWISAGDPTRTVPPIPSELDHYLN